MKSSYYLIPIAIFSIILLLSVDTEKAFAYSFREFDNGVTNNGIARIGDNIFVSNQASNAILRYDLSFTGIDSVVCTGCGGIVAVGNNIYTFGTSTLYEIGITTGDVMVVSRSVSTTDTCVETALEDNVNTETNEIVCAGSTAQRYKIFDLDTMTNTFTSGSLSAGGCTQPEGATVVLDDSGTDFIFLNCVGGTDAIQTLEYGTSTVLHTQTLLTLDIECGCIAYDTALNNLIVFRGASAPVKYEYTVAGGFTDEVTLADEGEIEGAHYDSVSKRVIAMESIRDGFVGFNIDDGATIFSVIPPSSILFTGNAQIVKYDATDLWYYTHGSIRFGEFDVSGLPTGTGGTEEEDPDTVGGIDCSLPANANILICRLGGDNNFGGIGNATGTGLLNLGCNVIFVDCTDTNPQTNGLGLLAFIASLFVIIGMFYYAMGKEAFHMPIFIWIVIVVALSAFFTITGWIDPIFLILSIVAIVALAVPKIISVTRGSTFGGGSTE